MGANAMATQGLNRFVRHLRRAALTGSDASLADGELLESYLARRDEAAFEALVRRHGPMVLGVCRRVLRNDADAEDAFQATFLVLVRKATSIRPRAMVGNWLHGVAHNTALKARAMNTKRMAKERQAAARPKPELTAENWERLRALLDQELKALPDIYQAPIVVCDLEGKTIKEAARQLGCPPGTVATRLTRGRSLLARRLTRHGVSLSGGVIGTVISECAATAGVSPLLLHSTVKAATLVAAGQAAASGVISAEVAALTEGVVKTMLLRKLKIATASIMALVVVAGGAGMFIHPVFGQRETGPSANAKALVSQGADDKVGEVRRFEGHTDGAHGVVFSPDGKRALSCAAQPGMDDSVVRLWDVATGKELKRFEGHTERVEAVALSPDGKRAASCGADKTIRLWDVEKGAEIRKFDGHDDNVYSVVFSPDGKRLLSASQDTTMRLWDVENGAELMKFEGHSDAVRGVGFSPDGKRALSAGWDKTVRLWDVDSGKDIRQFEGHTDEHVYSAVFSPDGKRAASCAGDETIRLWDVDSGKELQCFKGYTDKYVYAVAFSRDGKRLLSAGEDKTVRLWDAATGKELHCFTGHEERVRGVAFSPDGRYALSASVDKTLRLWRLPNP
jgi:RNA polymerase sigma factor (sigma-70 family)